MKLWITAALKRQMNPSCSSSCCSKNHPCPSNTLHHQLPQNIILYNTFLTCFSHLRLSRLRSLFLWNFLTNTVWIFHAYYKFSSLPFPLFNIFPWKSTEDWNNGSREVNDQLFSQAALFPNKELMVDLNVEECAWRAPELLRLGWSTSQLNLQQQSQ